MSLLAATWTSAITTVVLAFGAVITAVYAIKAYRKQVEQIELLQKQADRDIEQRRRAQASRVFTWVEPRPFGGNPDDMRPAACIRNTSKQPVYDIALGLGERADQHAPVLMPETEYVLPGLGTAFATGQRPVWVIFRDSAGYRWRVTTDGQFTELTASDPGYTRVSTARQSPDRQLDALPSAGSRAPDSHRSRRPHRSYPDPGGRARRRLRGSPAHQPPAGQERK